MTDWRWNHDGRFDGSAGLSFGFARAAATVDYAGAAVASGVPRYGPRSVLCGSPSVSTLLNASGNHRWMHSGCAGDNTTEVHFNFYDAGAKARIYVGDPTSTSDVGYQTSINTANAGSTRLAAAKTALATAGATVDFFMDASRLGNAPTNYINECCYPHAAVIGHGAIVVFGDCYVCSVDSDAGRANAANWSIHKCFVATALLSTIQANPSNPELWWTKHALSDDIGHKFGAYWSLWGPWDLNRSGAPTTLYFTISNYEGDPNKNGGLIALLKATRPSGLSGTWTFGKVNELPGRMTGFSNTRHDHAAGAVRNGVTGITVIKNTGDEQANAGFAVWSRTDEDLVTGGTDIGTNWLTGVTGWTAAPSVVHGYLNPLTAGPTSNAAANSSARRFGSQVVSFIPGPGGTLLTGADENCDAINSLTVPAVGGQLTISRLWSPVQSLVASPNNGSSSVLAQRYFVAFGLAGAGHIGSGPFACFVGPGASDFEQRRNCRIVYSPDGTNWGTAWQTSEAVGSCPITMGRTGAIYCGSNGYSLNQGIRKITPISVTRRPLRVGPGAISYLEASPTFSAGAASVVTVSSVNPALDSGMPSPPFQGPYWKITHTAANSDTDAGLGSFNLTVNLPNPASNRTKYIYIPVWILNRTPDNWPSSPSSAGVRLSFTLEVDNSGGGNSVVGGATAPFSFSAHNKWTKVLLPFYVASFSNAAGHSPAGYTAGEGAKLACTLYLTSFSGTPEPTSFFFGVEGLTGFGAADGLPNAAPCVALGSGTTMPAESASVSGFNVIGAAWTFIAHGQIPLDANWDDTIAASYLGDGTANVGGDTTKTTFSLPAGLNTTAGPGAANFFANHRVLEGVGNTKSSQNTGLLISASSYNAGSGLVTLTHDPQVTATSADLAVNLHVYPVSTLANARPLVSFGSTDETEGITFYALTGADDSVQPGFSCIVARIRSAGVYGTAEGVDQAMIASGNPSGVIAEQPFYFMPGSPIHLGAYSDGSDVYVFADVGCSGIGTSLGSMSGAASLKTKPWTKVVYRELAATPANANYTDMDWFGGSVSTTGADPTSALTNMSSLAVVGGGGAWPGFYMVNRRRRKKKPLLGAVP